MKDIFLVYDTSCFYEIVILNYFLSVSQCQVCLCSPGGKSIKSMEGYSVNVDAALEELDLSQVRSFIIPGGDITPINNQMVQNILQELRRKNALIAGICAGVNVLDKAGLLKNIKSTHSSDDDIVNDDNIITARANSYVDFALEVGKALDLFEDETNLQETVDFWKNFKRVQ